MDPFDDTEIKLLTENSYEEYNRLSDFVRRDEYRTQRGSKYVNIVDQEAGKNYCIPFESKRRNINTGFEQIQDEILNADQTEDKKEIPVDDKPPEQEHDIVPINTFFDYIEKCRIKNKMNLHYSERQYFTISQMGKHLYNPKDDPADAAIIPTDEPERVVKHSCMEFDFDVYLENEVKFDEQKIYYPLTKDIGSIICDVLDLEKSKCENVDVLERNDDKLTFKFYVAIMAKKSQKVKHPKYGECWKNGFHMRFYVKLQKVVKQYIRSLVIKRGILSERFSKFKLKCKIEDIIDPNSSSFPTMIYGCMKKGGNSAHKLIHFYQIIHETGCTLIVHPKSDFEPINKKVESIHKMRGANKITQLEDKTEYNYNICQELSLNFEAPGGLIKKEIFEPKSEIAAEIGRDAQMLDKNMPITFNNDDEINLRVKSIIVQDYSARWIRDILGLLNQKRLEDYSSWRSIMWAIAKESQEYIDIAIWISRRCPEKFNENRTTQEIKRLFSGDLGRERGGDFKPITFKTVEYWAKEDNPKNFQQMADDNAFHTLRKLALEFKGDLEDGHIAKVLSRMFAFKYRTSSNPYKTKSERKCWREFVFPSDTNQYTIGELYKWKLVNEPMSLKRYITNKVPVMLDEISKYIKDTINKRIEKQNIDENWQTFMMDVLKGLKKTERRCSIGAFVNSVINSAYDEFYIEGFDQHVNKNIPDHIGVINGVLQLNPKISLIRSYHDVPISRCMGAEYHPYDPNDPIVKEIETEYRRIFAEDEDAYEYVMIYLSSQLDAREKDPIFFLWIGPGSNGKSIILEMQLALFKKTTEEGYGGKIPITWFHEERKTGPDANVSVIDAARSLYTSEQNETSKPIDFGKIKEFLSETTSGNDKHEKQKMMNYHGNIVYASNFAPAVTNTDDGTWRRIRVYNFKMKFKNPADEQFDPNDKTYYPANPDIKKWKERPEYLNAYLSILTKWYAIYTEKYHHNFDELDKASPTIKKETLRYRLEQDRMAKFIATSVIKIGKYYPDTKILVPAISMSTIGNRYLKWLDSDTRDVKRSIGISSAITQFKRSELSKFIYPAPGSAADYLHQCALLEEGQTPEQAKVPPEKLVKEHQEKEEKRSLNDIADEVLIQNQLEIPSPDPKQIKLSKSVDLPNRAGEWDSSSSLDDEDVQYNDNIDIIITHPEESPPILEKIAEKSDPEPEPNSKPEPDSKLEPDPKLEQKIEDNMDPFLNITEEQLLKELEELEELKDLG